MSLSVYDQLLKFIFYFYSINKVKFTQNDLENNFFVSSCLVEGQQNQHHERESLEVKHKYKNQGETKLTNSYVQVSYVLFLPNEER